MFLKKEQDLFLLVGYFRTFISCGKHFLSNHMCSLCQTVPYFGLVSFQDSNNHSGDGTCCSVHLYGTQAHTCTAVTYTHSDSCLHYPQSYCVGVLQAALLFLIQDVKTPALVVSAVGCTGNLKYARKARLSATQKV